MGDSPILKPCPFCGSKARYGRDVMTQRVRAGCGYDCVHSHGFTTLEKAADWWNRRKPGWDKPLSAPVSGEGE